MFVNHFKQVQVVSGVIKNLALPIVLLLAVLPTLALSSSSTLQLTPEEQQWIAEHPVIRIGVDPDFAPYEFVDSSGAALSATPDAQTLRAGLGAIH